MNRDSGLMSFDEAMDSLGLFVTGADLKADQGYVEVGLEADPWNTRYIPTMLHAELTLTINGDPDSMRLLVQRLMSYGN